VWIGERDVVQDLCVLDAHEDGEDLVVSLYGSKRNVCGTVRFRLTDARARRRSLQLVTRWANRNHPVTLVRTDGSMSLVSERSILQRALSAR
jgi:hypothetical protein